MKTAGKKISTQRWLSTLSALGLILVSTSVLAKKPTVVINPQGLTPEEIKMITDGVAPVVRLADDQDAGEASRLLRKAHDAVVSALTTQGYFDPNVSLTEGKDFEGDTWDIAVKLGKRSTVQSVEQNFSGAINNPTYANRLEKIKAAWSLKKGDDFINAKWSAAKSQVLDSVQNVDFYLARLMFSQAVVNPEKAKVDTTVTVDSGPVVTYGPIEVIGLRRVPNSIVSRYIKYKPGQAYKQDDLDAWQQKLQSTNFFSGTFVTIKPSKDPNVYKKDQVELPIQVKVSEAPARSITGVLSLDSENLLGVEALYKQNIIWGLPLAFEAGASANFNEQRLFTDFYLPPNDDDTRDSFGVAFRHTDVNNLDVYRAALGWKRTHQFKLDPESRVDYQSNWSVLGAYDKGRIKGVANSSYTIPSIIGTWDFMRRDVNDMYDPREGNLVALSTGLGLTLDKREPFSRISLRGQKWWPVGKYDVVTARAQVGQIIAAKNARVPDDFGYRTGGAGTIRGYRYLAIGQKVGDAVIGNRSLGVASVEYMHYFTERLGMGVFVDVGDAPASFKQWKPYVGYGVGARVRTPAGPLLLDLAYGQKDRALRLDFSLGVAF